MKALLLLAGLAVSASANEFQIVADDSSVLFRVRHMAGRVTGRFPRFSGKFVYVPGKPKLWRAEADIDAASVDTTSPARDEHLRNEDFFDVARCGTITFRSTGVQALGPKRARLKGELTVKCVKKPVEMDLLVLDEGRDERGLWQAAKAVLRVARKDFGITWTKPGSALFIGENVEIELDVQGLLAAAPK